MRIESQNRPIKQSAEIVVYITICEAIWGCIPVDYDWAVRTTLYQLYKELHHFELTLVLNRYSNFKYKENHLLQGEQDPCNFCGKTLREQMKGCGEITCYRQQLKK